MVEAHPWQAGWPAVLPCAWERIAVPCACDVESILKAEPMTLVQAAFARHVEVTDKDRRKSTTVILNERSDRSRFFCSQFQIMCQASAAVLRNR